MQPLGLVHRTGAVAVVAGRDRVVGRDAVEADLMLRQLQRHGAGEVEHPGLAGGVDGEVGRRARALDRRDVDDRPAPAAADHDRHGHAGGDEHAHQVDLDVPAPAPLALLEERTPGDPAGVVDQDVDPPEFLVGRRHHRADLLALHYVGGNAERLAAHVADAPGGLLAARGLDVGDHHVGAVLGERQGDPLTNAAATAGDDRHLVRQCSLVDRHGAGPSIMLSI